MRNNATQEPDDATIVVWMMDSNQDGLRALLRLHGPHVVGFLRKRWAGHLDEHEREAVFNYAAWKVWRFIHRYDDRKKSLRAWFVLVAHREAMTARRTRTRESLARLEHDPGYDPGAERSEAETAAEPQSPQSRRSKDLEEVIAILPPLQQRIAVADLEDPSNRADSARLSQLLGSPINSIEVSRNKARKKIEAAMRERGHYQPARLRSAP